MANEPGRRRRGLRNFVKRSELFRFPLMGLRAAVAGSHLAAPLGQMLRWIATSREHTNFTYDLDDLNKLYLAHFLATATGQPVETMQGLIRELEDDAELATHLSTLLLEGPYRAVSDPQPKYGRRLGWYALVRATRPRLVIETGVDKGLGACVITAALLRNAREGHPGRYLGTDINPDAGYLLRGAYAAAGQIRYGDSIETLRGVEGPIDLFINDSDHSADYEAREYETVRNKLSPKAMVVSDNADGNDKLAAFAAARGMRFLFFKESPKEHWYPGAGIGLAFREPGR